MNGLLSICKAVSTLFRSCVHPQLNLAVFWKFLMLHNDLFTVHSEYQGEVSKLQKIATLG